MGMDASNKPCANASAAILDAPNPLCCIAASTNLLAPDANAGIGLPSSTAVLIALDILAN